MDGITAICARFFIQLSNIAFVLLKSKKEINNGDKHKSIAFSNRIAAFQERNASVSGVSIDSHFSHLAKSRNRFCVVIIFLLFLCRHLVLQRAVVSTHLYFLH